MEILSAREHAVLLSIMYMFKNVCFILFISERAKCGVTGVPATTLIKLHWADNWCRRSTTSWYSVARNSAHHT